MKTRFRIKSFAMAVLLICALAIATSASAKNPKVVDLEIVVDQLIVTTKGNANDCPWTLGETREKGCIKVKRNNKSEIYFQLKGNAKCGLESGTDWELNAVYLGGFNSKKKPTGGFGFANTPDPDFNKVKADFNMTDADRTSGNVPIINPSANKLTIIDYNKHEYVVWYKIEAICKREDGKPAHVSTYDPRVKNGGTE